MLIVNSRIRIPESELQWTFARSSGPGGQNVNKVSSKAVLRWHAAGSASLPKEVRERFLARFASRLTTTGELIISSQRYRDQPRNISDAQEKLRAMLASVRHAAEEAQADQALAGRGGPPTRSQTGQVSEEGTTRRSLGDE